MILFGLSMDYHVFLLSRIREAVERGASTDEAVAQGIKSTAGVVTSAALVMVAVFSVFIALSMLFFKQFGVGLAAAILIDATIVRGVLLPASMKLLGDWNWYLPTLARLAPAPPRRGRAVRAGDRGELETRTSEATGRQAVPPGRRRDESVVRFARVRAGALRAGGVRRRACGARRDHLARLPRRPDLELGLPRPEAAPGALPVSSGPS